MEFWLKSKDVEIRLPVTPESFCVNIGNNISTVNIINSGDLNIVGNSKLSIVKLDIMIPYTQYNFVFPTTIGSTNPYSYIAYFNNFINNKDIVQFIITDTPINLSCILEDFTYSEKDGTRDLYVTINLRQYRQQEFITADKLDVKDNKPRKATITTTIESNSSNSQSSSSVKSSSSKKSSSTGSTVYKNPPTPKTTNKTTTKKPSPQNIMRP